MRVTDQGNRGPIWGEFTRAQNGKVIDNLARAFHLPRPKAKAALISMLADLIESFDAQALSRAPLARLIELLGKNDYERVLDDPTLMGATSTQVIGNEALTALTGHNKSIQITGAAAKAATISNMIAEYLLPVVAAMFMGALSQRTRARMLALARNEEDPAEETGGPTSLVSVSLPAGRGSGGAFGGATIIRPDLGPEREAIYRELAERVRRGGADDPINLARRIMADVLGIRMRYAPWLARAQLWASVQLHVATTQIQERLRKLRSR
jgi:hypothetical protein